ncbi:hypothetical protein NCAS_0I00650 [Naumovozyma castellii]|uniref:Uncharacterized protein n=1 Tax=Naumovozyma castellii TaxID=27288 RepID=G0VJQ2_NAUCA|nr:hypothetical protein NCAS_0I00650 [Naumovozyma castellii CBS 4309]CCC71733.1 hypothetical protein NCAS_0I00650 [Naumovozyma castellii CBS 4309]
MNREEREQDVQDWNRGEDRTTESDNDSTIEENKKGPTSLNLSLSNSKYSRIISFVSSSSINLFLPFLNGLMLGFGELFAHEISWRFNWFGGSNNRGYKIYPESRKRKNTMDSKFI